MLKKLYASTLLFACCTAAVSAQENRWYDPFFISGALQYYMVPELFSGLIKPIPGFRAALGYEYRRFYLAVESGDTRIEGTNPLVLDLRFIPVAIKAGYALPIRWGLGVQADVSFGWLFSNTVHYVTAIDLLLENQKESSTRSYMTGARLFGTYSFIRRAGDTYALKLYAGGGVDAVFETDGVIPMPVIEAGISFKPLSLIRPRAAQRGQVQDELPPLEPEEDTGIEQIEQGRAARLLGAVHFEADSTGIIERYMPILDRAGELLRADPLLRITLRGYAAPFGTEAGQITLSAARSWRCAEHLMRMYGIAEERIGMEFYGADKMPEWEDAEWEFWRRVELLIEGEE